MGENCTYSKVRKKKRVPDSPTLIQHSIGIPTLNKKTSERNKRDSNTEKVKLSLFKDDMILYVKDPRTSTKKLIDFKHFQ
jgi:hypothetical protein